ncbi:MAG: transcription termination/antitermination protein NusG [Gammaproteobacteria bacterium]
MQADVESPAYRKTPGWSDASEPIRRWHVLWTRSNCERLVYGQLAEKGYEAFLPTVHRWSRTQRAQRLYQAPLFPGYLFVRHAFGKNSYLDICKTRGLVRVLGERWDRLAVVPDFAMEAIRKLQESDLPRMPYAYLREGERVRIVSGPLVGVEGILRKLKPNVGLLVLSIDLLARSVAVEVDGSQVVPA